MARARAILCAFCGTGIAPEAWGNHQATCIPRWREERSSLPEELQMQTPKNPTHGVDIHKLSNIERAALNEKCKKLHQQLTTFSCSTCNKKFDSGAKLVKHRASCKSRRALGVANQAVHKRDKPSTRAGPRFFVCVHCGKEFGAGSLAKHQTLCLERWRKERAALPTDLQKPTPRCPEVTPTKLQSMTENDRLEFNTACSEIYRTTTMIGCQYCDRKFDKYDKMLKHLNDCAAAAEFKKVERRNKFKVGLLGVIAANNFIKAQVPRFYACLYCGQEFGARSLPIHAPQCLEKWRHERAQMPEALQKPTPRAPELECDLSSMHENARVQYNNQILQRYREEIMVGCPHCDRKFNGYIKMTKHMNDCEAARQAARAKRTITFGEDGRIVHEGLDELVAARPKFFACVYCGQEFGAQSLPIHMPQCVEKWRHERARQPANLQNPTPRPPEAECPFHEMTDEMRQKYNDQVLEQYRDETMVGCPYCDRKFNGYIKMTKHLNDCEGARQAARAPKTITFGEDGKIVHEGADEVAASKPRFFACIYCGQEFGAQSLPIHMPQCLEKWRNHRKTLPTQLQLATPRAPEISCEFADMDDGERLQYNNDVLQRFRDETMVQCLYCPRKFTDYMKMSKHLNNCEAAETAPVNRARQSRTSLDDEKAKPAAGPRFFGCVYCGKEFGSASLSIHLVQCVTKWRKQRTLLPRDLQRPTPRPPTLNVDPSMLTEAERQKYNAEAAQTFNKFSSVTCATCSRTFADFQQYRKHSTSCRAGSSSNKPARRTFATIVHHVLHINHHAQKTVTSPQQLLVPTQFQAASNSSLLLPLPNSQEEVQPAGTTSRANPMTALRSLFSSRGMLSSRAQKTAAKQADAGVFWGTEVDEPTKATTSCNPAANDHQQLPPMSPPAKPLPSPHVARDPVPVPSVAVASSSTAALQVLEAMAAYCSTFDDQPQESMRKLKDMAKSFSSSFKGIKSPPKSSAHTKQAVESESVQRFTHYPVQHTQAVPVVLIV